MAISEAVPASRVARVLGIATIFRDLRGGATVFLPPQIAVFAQGNTSAVFSSDRRTLTSGAGEAASVYGFGSPIHTIVQRLLPATGDGVGATPITIYPLADGGVAAAGDITPVGVPTADFTATLKLGGRATQQIVIPEGSSVADMVTIIHTAIAATLDVPCTSVDSATQVDLTCKWAGETGNSIGIEIEGGEAAGTTFAITAMAGGSGNPDPTSALTMMGTRWETIVINGLNWDDTTALDAFMAHGDGRWTWDTHAPYTAISTATGTDLAAMVAHGNARKSDKVNVVEFMAGGPDMPWEYTARAVVRIANLQGSNPPTDYARQSVSLLRAGPDNVQPDVFQRETLVQAGISTTEVVSGAFELSDTITMYHPDTEEIPGYRYVVDITRLQNIIFNIRLEFIKPEWDGAPLLSDDTPTNNPRAKKPRMAKGKLAQIVDNLALDAILTNPEEIKLGIQAGINGSNPKRLDMKVPTILSGNVNVRSVDLEFGFNFG